MPEWGQPRVSYGALPCHNERGVLDSVLGTIKPGLPMTGSRPLELVREYPLALTIIDHAMPGMNARPIVPQPARDPVRDEGHLLD